ncbi:hypothetical protein HK099_000725 [Clydaea vesicula]|uniref:Uncharacterized protein n=1 Tax=Clydaea vesicula TaxID=447962 RepID=A0AAD5TUF9_9FUNG|nr:hypothetical protein HK099_000725 [Clydaea vesicula]
MAPSTYEPSAQVYARSLAFVSSFALFNGGLYTFLWSWQTIPDLLPPSIYGPLPYTGVLALLSSFIIYALESFPDSFRSIQFWPKIVFYFLLGIIVFFTLTLVIASTCLFVTSIVLTIGAMNSTPPSEKLPR